MTVLRRQRPNQSLEPTAGLFYNDCRGLFLSR